MSSSLLSRALISGVSARPCLTTVPVRNHVGYIPFEGRPGDIDNEIRRFNSESVLLNMQPIKKVTYSMDPFHPKITSLRNAMVHMSFKRVRSTNPKCLYKTEILSDSSAPRMKLELNNGKTILFKTDTLVGSDLLHEMNKIVLPLVEELKDERVTKAAQVTAGGGGGGAKQAQPKKKKK